MELGGLADSLSYGSSYSVVKLTGEYHRISDQHTELYGHPTDDLRQKGGMDFVHPDDKSNITRAFMEIANTNKPQEYEYRIKDSDGHWMTIQAYAEPIWIKGELKYFLNITRPVLAMCLMAL